MILSLLLGDGCVNLIQRGNKRYGYFIVDHGLKQADYQAWKAELLSHITGRKVKVRKAHKGKSVVVSVGMKRFAAWRKFCYTDGKKDIAKILRFINNPKFAIAVWLMDDGYCESSPDTLKSGKKKHYSARLRMFTCETPKDKQYEIQDWLKNNLDIDTKVHQSKKKDKYYPYLKINQKNSLKLWSEIREFVLQFKSMQYKFRHLESVYQRKMLQRKAP